MGTMEGIKEKIERMKIKADALIAENKPAFIKDSNETYFSCYIIKNEEHKLFFKPFEGNNTGELLNRYWADILKFVEYSK